MSDSQHLDPVHSLAESNASKKSIQNLEAILDTLSQTQSQFITSKSPLKLAEICEVFLQTLLFLTESQHGFIVSIEDSKANHQNFTTYAASESSLKEEITFLNHPQPNGIVPVTAIQELILTILKTSKPLIGTNGILSSKIHRAFPVKNFAGIPLISKDYLIGVIFLFNTTHDDYSYSQDLVSTLMPILQAIILMFEAAKLEYERDEVERLLREREGMLSISLNQLEWQKQELEIANQTKNIFLNNMTHEIRNHLNGLMGMTELLLNTDLNHQQMKYANRVYQSSEALLKMINDILEVTLIESDDFKLELKEFNLAQLIQDLIPSFVEISGKKNIEILFNSPSEMHSRLIGDPLRIKQILSYLIDNALKFTDQGRVLINVIQKKESEEEVVIRLEVVDTGIGISVEIQQHIFLKFFRGDSSFTRKYRGNGLGLSISKILAAKMQGQIGVISDEGQGSTFWVELPLNLPKQITS